jgi:hypothetical protein
MTTLCAVCDTPLQLKEGPGRPPTYCGEGCRRLAEMRIRLVTRRLAAYEGELREVEAGCPGRFAHLEPDELRKRARDLKRWMKADAAELHLLFSRPEAIKETKERS